MKKDWIITILVIIVGLLTLGVVLYTQTNFFQTIIDWLMWFYNGLRKFKWD